MSRPFRIGNDLTFFGDNCQRHISAFLVVNKNILQDPFVGIHMIGVNHHVKKSLSKSAFFDDGSCFGAC
ncbi:hypothetical protein D3C87_1656250 [compost metagenome]